MDSDLNFFWQKYLQEIRKAQVKDQTARLHLDKERELIRKRQPELSPDEIDFLAKARLDSNKHVSGLERGRDKSLARASTYALGVIAGAMMKREEKGGEHLG